MKTILTVGVYDMLHIGHILLFKHAKGLGDKLIVAIQDGEYIQKYKSDTKEVEMRRFDKNWWFWQRIKLFGGALFFFLFCQGCYSSDFDKELEGLNCDNPEYIFNKNIQSIRQLLYHVEHDGMMTAIDSSDTHVYALHYKEQDTPIIFCRNNHFDIKWPDFSIKPLGTHYYWALGNSFLLNQIGEKILVADDTLIPHFKYTNGRWSIQLDAMIEDIPDSLLTENFITILTLAEGLTAVLFPSSYELTTPMESFKTPLVPQQSFYKDIFLDAGIGLTTRKFLYAARYLGLSTECVSLPYTGATEEDSVLQNDMIAGNEQDTNGRLLYPDGQPRYRLLFVCGGSSRNHGMSLNNSARRNMKQFVENGGSYVGTCAGAFFASNGYDGNTDYPYYLSVVPSMMNHTGLSNVTTGMIINQESSLLNYYDFGGDNYVSKVRHNKGGYPVTLPSGSEILARYDYPLKEDVHGQPCAWSYKLNSIAGRVVLEGSHPEEVSEGERRDLTAAFILYAMDGLGLTPLKGFLQNGKTRIMNCNSEENNPHFTKIGDLQCHHFAVNIPKGAENVRIRLYSESECNFSLSMTPFTFAYPENAEYISADNSSCQSLFFSSLASGLWYVSVKCNTSIEVNETDYGQGYIDSTGALNGFPYQITVSWETTDEKSVAASTNKVYRKGLLQKVNTLKLVHGLDGKVYRTPPSNGIYLYSGKKVLPIK